MSDLELPPFLKRKKVQDRDGRLWTNEYASPHELRHISPEQFILMITERAARALDAAGAIGPYEYSCRLDPGVGYFFTASEL